MWTPLLKLTTAVFEVTRNPADPGDDDYVVAVMTWNKTRRLPEQPKIRDDEKNGGGGLNTRGLLSSAARVDGQAYGSNTIPHRLLNMIHFSEYISPTFSELVHGTRTCFRIQSPHRQMDAALTGTVTSL